MKSRETIRAEILEELRVQAELANKTGKSRSTISRQIKQLEAAGAIVRMPSGKYRRNN